MRCTAMHTLNFLYHIVIQLAAAKIAVEFSIGEAPAIFISLAAHPISRRLLHGPFGHTESNANFNDFRCGIVKEWRKVSTLIAPLGIITNIGLRQIAGIGHTTADLVGNHIKNCGAQTRRVVVADNFVDCPEISIPCLLQSIIADLYERPDVIEHPLDFEETSAALGVSRILLDSRRKHYSQNAVAADRSDAGCGNCCAILAARKPYDNRSVGAILLHIIADKLNNSIRFNSCIKSHYTPPFL